MERSNIYLRKDGRWEGRIYQESKNGKRQYHAFYGCTKEIVEQKMTEFRQRSIKCAAESVLFSKVLEEWFHSVQYRVKESTAANYRLKADKHILPKFSGKEINCINQDDIYTFIDEKQNAGLSNRYISDILIMMKSVFKFAAKNHHISNPMAGISMPKKQKPKIRLLDNTEQDQLIQYIAQNQNLTTLGITLALSTGVRIGELCALQWEDIDLKKRILTVRKTIQRVQCKQGNARTKFIITDPKSENACRIIPIPEFLIGFLKKYLGNANVFLLSGNEKPLEPRTMQYRFAKILKNVNLPSIHFHALRHMFASTCMKLNFDVKTLSELLGHSTVETTLNRYVHSSFDQKIKYMNRLKMVF